MNVFIIRHAQAVVGENNDANRALDEEGKHQAAILASWLDEQVTQPFTLISSPYLRAKQTAGYIAEKLNCERQQSDTLTPDSSTQDALETLAHYKQDLIVVAHQPLVGRLASQLVDGDDMDQPWNTAECRILEGDMAARACMRIKTLWYPQ